MMAFFYARPFSRSKSWNFKKNPTSSEVWQKSGVLSQTIVKKIIPSTCCTTYFFLITPQMETIYELYKLFKMRK